MARKGSQQTAQRKQARVHLSGEVFEQQRKELTRHKEFPRRNYYAYSLSHNLARLDGRDEVGEMLGEAGASLRARLVNIWTKMGNIVVEYEGQLRLAVIIE